MKKSILLFLALFTATSHVQAATSPAPYLSGNITRTYNAEDLKTRSALLDVSIGDIWVINLPDDVTDVITSKQGVLQFKQSGSKVIVGALATSGTYPVLVTTADDVYFFTVRLTGQKGGGVRNVNVTAATATDSSEEAAPIAAPTVATPNITGPNAVSLPNTAAKPANTATQAQSRPAPAAPVRPTITPAATPVSVPSAAASAAQPAGAAPVAATKPAAPEAPQLGPALPLATPIAPRTPAYQLDYRAMSNGVQTALYYHISNSSSQPVMFDERALTLLGPNGKLPFVPATTPVNVAPGKDVYGQITVLSTLKVMQAYWSPLGDAALDTKTINVETLIP